VLSCHCCPTLQLVLFDLAIGFAGFNCGFLVDSDPCSCWIGFLVCWTLIGRLFHQVLLLFLVPGLLDLLPCLSLVEINSATSIDFWFWFSWSCLVYFTTFLCPSCVDLFSRLGVQGGHSFEPIYWLFAVVNFSALSLTFPQTLVSCSSCLPRLL